MKKTKVKETAPFAKGIKAFGKITNVDFGMMLGLEEPTLRLILHIDRTFYVLDEIGNDVKNTYLFFKGDRLNDFIKEFKIESIHNLIGRTCLVELVKAHTSKAFRTEIPFSIKILYVTDDQFVDGSEY